MLHTAAQISFSNFALNKKKTRKQPSSINIHHSALRTPLCPKIDTSDPKENPAMGVYHGSMFKNEWFHKYIYIYDKDLSITPKRNSVTSLDFLDATTSFFDINNGSND